MRLEKKDQKWEHGEVKDANLTNPSWNKFQNKYATIANYAKKHTSAIRRVGEKMSGDKDWAEFLLYLAWTKSEALITVCKISVTFVFIKHVPLGKSSIQTNGPA